MIIQFITFMKEYGFTGLEIAPTRIFPENPYSKNSESKAWSDEIPLTISSMQSIWYGKTESIFGSDEERYSFRLHEEGH